MSRGRSAHFSLHRLSLHSDQLITVVESDPSDLATKLQLAEVYEEMDDRSRALTLVNEGESQLPKTC